MLEFRTVQQMYKPKSERNNQMKKFTCAMMALLMVVSMAACAGNDAGQETAKPTEGTTATKPSTGATTAPTKPTTESTTAPTDTTEATEAFEKQVLVENDQIAVTVTGVKTDDVWGYTLQVLLENKTDKSLMFSVDDVSVNGFMIDPLWAETVAPGKKSNAEIRFSPKSLQDNGIETVTDLEFVLRVYNDQAQNEEDLHNQKHELKMQ